MELWDNRSVELGPTESRFRVRVARLMKRLPERLVWSVFMFVNGAFSIGLLALIALRFRMPFVFPCLGPTAILFFFNPTRPPASPRNTIYGHSIGILCGYGALWLTGLIETPSALVMGMDPSRVVAVALSVAATGALMILANCVHPPAGATTLIISLGIITLPREILLIEAAVVVLTAQAILINRLAGVPYPLWRPVASELVGGRESR